MKVKYAVATTVLLAGMILPATAQNAVSLFTSPQHVANSVKEQHFQDQWTLQPNQEKLPLTLTVKNGGAGKRGLNWFRVSCNGYLIATDKDLNGKNEASIDVSGRIQQGTSQLLIDAAGEPGTEMQYSLSTLPVTVNSVRPSSVAPGQEIIIRGNNFSSDENQDVVSMNGKQLQILSAGKTSITALVPMNAAGGTNKLSVTVNGLQSVEPAALNVSSVPQPVLTGSNFWMAPPGAQLVIAGSNFAASGNGDKVYFNNVAAQVVSGDSNSITVVIPNWSYGGSQLNIPITVVANGVRSSNTLPFDIGPKYLGQLPPMPGDSESQASNEFSASQSTSSASSQATLNANSEASTQSGSSSKLIIEPRQ